MLISRLLGIPSSSTENWQNRLFTLAFQWQPPPGPKQTIPWAQPSSSWNTRSHQQGSCEIPSNAIFLVIKAPAVCAAVLAPWSNLTCPDLHLNLKGISRVVIRDGRGASCCKCGVSPQEGSDTFPKALPDFSSLIIISDSCHSHSAWLCDWECVSVCSCYAAWQLPLCGQCTPEGSTPQSK